MAAKSTDEKGGALRVVTGHLESLRRVLTARPFPESISLILLILGIDAAFLLVGWGAWGLGREGLAVLFFVSQIVLTFALFGLDRMIAPLSRRGQRWRVSDRNLLLACLLGGALGGLFGMALFRHKTGERIRSLNFRWLVVATLVVNLLGLLIAFSVAPAETPSADGSQNAPVEERSG